MSAIFKTHGGGSGPSASIFVKGLSESDTVYATKDGVVKEGKWTERNGIGGHLISRIKDLGMWTVTAANGEKTVTQDVLIDVITEYEIEMDFPANYLMLYDFGDECENVTGGWEFSRDVINTVHFLFATTQLEVPLSRYTKIGAKYTVKATTAPEVCGIYFGVPAVGVDNQVSFSNGTHLLAYDIEQQDNPVSLMVYNGGNATNTQTKNADNIYQRVYINGSDYREVTAYAVFLLKEDGYAELCNIAGVSVPADLATLIADITSISAILASEAAVNYMVAACTGDFMAAFVANSACLLALNMSPHKSLVTANPHWAKFLAMVQ